MNQKAKKHIVKSLAVLLSTTSLLPSTNLLTSYAAGNNRIKSTPNTSNHVIDSADPINDPIGFFYQHIREDGQRPVVITQTDQGIETFYDINGKDSLGRTPLMLATMWGREIVEELIQNGANINDKDNEGKNVLVHAIINNKLEIVNFLLEHNADINANDNLGRNALMYAVNTGQNEIINTLLEYIARKNPQNPNAVQEYVNTSDGAAFIFAARNGYTEIVLNLLNHGANIDSCVLGTTAIEQASKNGHIETVKFLLENDVCTYDVTEAIKCSIMANLFDEDDNIQQIINLLKDYFYKKEGYEFQI